MTALSEALTEFKMGRAACFDGLPVACRLPGSNRPAFASVPGAASLVVISSLQEIDGVVTDAID